MQRTYRLRCDDKETMTEWLDVLKKTAEEAQKHATDTERRKKSKQTDGSKHPWTKQEDDLLKKLIDKHGPKDWSDLAKGVSVGSWSLCAAVSRHLQRRHACALCRSKAARGSSAASGGRTSWTPPCARGPGQRRRTRR